MDRGRRVTLGADKGYDTRDFVAAYHKLRLARCAGWVLFGEAVSERD